MEVYFILLVLLLAKHFIFDFAWQTNFELTDKKYPWSIGSIYHGVKHQFGTWLILILMFHDIMLASMLSYLDFVIHVHVDWIKNRIKYSPNQTQYWISFGLDQYIHQLTYIIITYLAMVWITQQ